MPWLRSRGIQADGGKAVAVKSDNSLPDSANMIAAAAREAFGPIIMLVCAAGISIPWQRE